MAVIIRETYQHPSQEGQLSFPLKSLGSLRPYVSDKILRHQIEYNEAEVIGTDYIAPHDDEVELLSSEPVDEGNEDDE